MLKIFSVPGKGAAPDVSLKGSAGTVAAAVQKSLHDDGMAAVWDGEGFFYVVSKDAVVKKPLADMLKILAERGVMPENEPSEKGMECLNEFSMFVPLSSQGRKQLEKRVMLLNRENSENIACKPCKGGAFLVTRNPVLTDVLDSVCEHVQTALKNCGFTKTMVSAEIRETYMSMERDETTFAGRLISAYGISRISPAGALKALEAM